MARASTGFSGGRTATRVRNGIPVVPALHGDRHGGGKRAYEPRHDDAAAQRRVAAVQADLLRVGGRLATGVGQSGAEFLRVGIMILRLRRPGSAPVPASALSTAKTAVIRTVK